MEYSVGPSDALKQDILSKMLLFSSAFIVPSFATIKTIPNQTAVRKLVAGRPRITTPVKDQYNSVVAKQNKKLTSTRLISIFAAASR